MSEPALDREDGAFTFTEEDFERRYYSAENNGPALDGRIEPPTVSARARLIRSPNRFMRTLIRRRLASGTR